jgi:hypothetical protein
MSLPPFLTIPQKEEWKRAARHFLLDLKLPDIGDVVCVIFYSSISTALAPPFFRNGPGRGIDSGEIIGYS